MVPHEDSYKIQLHQFLAAHLPPSFAIDGGMNGPKALRPDIVVGNRSDERVVLEIMAHERDGPENHRGSVLEHIYRCHKQYSKIDNVKETWVVNFTTRQPNLNKAGYGYVWSKYKNVQVIHVWHNLDWTTATTTQQVNGKMVTNNLNLNQH